MRVSNTMALGCGCGSNVAPQPEETALGSSYETEPVDAAGNTCPIIDDDKLSGASRADLESWRERGCLSAAQLAKAEARLEQLDRDRIKWVAAGTLVFLGAIALIWAVAR